MFVLGCVLPQIDSDHSNIPSDLLLWLISWPLEVSWLIVYFCLLTLKGAEYIVWQFMDVNKWKLKKILLKRVKRKS